MNRQVDPGIARSSERIADLETKTAELVRQLSEARTTLELELAQLARQAAPPGAATERAGRGSDEHPGIGPDRGGPSPATAGYLWPNGASAHPSGQPAVAPLTAEDRTEILVSRGRHGAIQRGLSRRGKVAAGAGALVLAIVILVIVLSSSAPSWPASVPLVQHEAAMACRNPNVKSEPDQVNFACAKASQQILWVFALITSSNNPSFRDARTGRVGLEPITPTQGGEIAWSLNLHHPYDPRNPVDSLAVAARAINNIVGGATLTGTRGNAVVQPGLEGSAANCRKYTGSPAVISRHGFPGLCANPVASLAGQAALVADIYRRWVVGAAPAAARDAAVLFGNAKNPGAAQVQAILKRLPDRKLLA